MTGTGRVITSSWCAMRAERVREAWLSFDAAPVEAFQIDGQAGGGALAACIRLAAHAETAEAEDSLDRAFGWLDDRFPSSIPGSSRNQLRRCAPDAGVAASALRQPGRIDTQLSWCRVHLAASPVRVLALDLTGCLHN